MPVPATGFCWPSARAKRLFRALVCLPLLAPLAAPAADRVELAVTYRADLLRNESGGLATGSALLDDLNVTLRIDLETGPAYSTVFLSGLYNNGTHFSRDFVGDLQVVSNIEADEAWRLFEAWYEYGGERWSLRGGLYDLNSEFDVNEAGALFLHSSHGIGADIGQTGRNGPGIFPVSAFALRGSLALGTGRLSVAALDGVPGDADDASSNRVRLSSEEGALLIAQYSQPVRKSMRVWGGYWAYTEQSERPFDPGPAAVNNGWYVGAEGRFGRAAWFLRYGEANPDVNAFADYVGVGLVMPSPAASRPDDQIGVAVASAGAGAPYRLWLGQAGSGARSRETAWELTYRMPIGRRLTLQPDIQYVQNPAASANVASAFVMGLRFELSY